MKTIYTSVGLLALGASIVAPSAHAEEAGKPWNVSASLRGFYDDNWTTASIRTNRSSSFGFDLSPSASFKQSYGPTDVEYGYTYGMKYYESRKNNSADHSHDAEVKIKHVFPERVKLTVSDSFVVAQESAVLDTSGVSTSVKRSNGNNLRNSGGVTLGVELTRLLSTEIGYNNNLFSYDDKGPNSRSALLDRVEHLGHLDLRWEFEPTTVGILGYQYGYTAMGGRGLISGIKDTIPGSATASPSTRDTRSHYVYVGADHSFSQQLTGSARAGFQYTQFPFAEGGKSSTTSPYADFSGSYAYSPDGGLSLGIRHSRNATDLAGGTLDAESTTVYSQITHKFSDKLTASVNAQYQLSDFKGGGANGKSDNLFLAGVSGSYEIVKARLWAEAGYNYDRLDSDLSNRSFYRNRVFLGLKASY